MKYKIKPSEEMLNILREDFEAQNWDCLFGDVFIFPEDFLREFSDKVYWYYISSNQKLSEGFIAENFQKLNIENLLQNKNLSEEIKNYIRMFI